MIGFHHMNGVEEVKRRPIKLTPVCFRLYLKPVKGYYLRPLER